MRKPSHCSHLSKRRNSARPSIASCRDLLQEQTAQTVASADEIGKEIRYLLSCLYLERPVSRSAAMFLSLPCNLFSVLPMETVAWEVVARSVSARSPEASADSQAEGWCASCDFIDCATRVSGAGFCCHVWRDWFASAAPRR